MVMNKRQKGQVHVRQAMAVYESRGWKCWHPGAKAQWIGPGRVISQSQDIWGCADFVARKEGQVIHCVQVKTGSEKDTTSDAAKARVKFDSLPPTECCKDVIMVKFPRHEWLVWTRWTGLDATVLHWTEIGQKKLEEMLGELV